DEHFRMMLCLSQDVGESPEAQKHWEAIFRSLQRPQARGMTTALLGSVGPVQAMTWGGIHVGTRLAFKVDLERINRVISRTVRGLYFKEMGRRLPEDVDVSVLCDETLIRQSREYQERMKEKV